MAGRRKLRLVFLSASFLALAVATVLLAPSQRALAFSAYGNGTSAKPYRISNCSQLAEINVQFGYYVIVRNIDCSGSPFTTLSVVFRGTLDGQNHTISNLNVTGSGLFTSIGNGATVKNLNIVSGSAHGTTRIGSIAASAGGAIILNVHSTMDLDASNTCGGLVGAVSGSATSISQSSFNGTIHCLNQIGGIAGTIGGGTIADAYTGGTIYTHATTGSLLVGGLVGVANANTVHTIRSYTTSRLEFAEDGDLSTDYGGLMGRSNSSYLQDSFSALTMSETFGVDIGGVLGYQNSGVVSNVFYDQGILGTIPGGGELRECGFIVNPASCTAINGDGQNPDYFKGNSSAAPLNVWDFTNIWSQSPGNYPALRKMSQFKSSLGDYNHDGADDGYQGFITTAEDADSLPVTISLPGSSACTVDDAVSINAEQSKHDAEYVGIKNTMTDFNIYCPSVGMTVPITLTYDKVYDTTGAVLRYYNTATNEYSIVPDAVFGTSTINGIAHTTASYDLTDGGSLDGDGVADGVIQDPVGISVVQIVTTSPGNGSNPVQLANSSSPLAISQNTSDELAKTGESVILISCFASLLIFAAFGVRYIAGKKS
jgi:hypothetical protein